MNDNRFVLAALASLLGLALSVGAGHSQTKKQRTKEPERVIKVYSLADCGNDPKLGTWLAESIPSLVEPGSWRHDVRYIESSRMLVVVHTPAVQAKVEGLLKEVRQAAAKNVAKDVGLLPAQHVALQSVPESGAAKPGAGYPIPAPLEQPKHLFHLLFGFKGDTGDASSNTFLESINKNLPTVPLLPTQSLVPSTVQVVPATPAVAATGEDKVPLVLPKIFPAGQIEVKPAEMVPAAPALNPHFAPTVSAALGDVKDHSKSDPQKASYVFSFLVRYEGDGIVDANVVKFAKAIVPAEKKASGEKEAAPDKKMPAADPLENASPSSLPEIPKATLPTSPTKETSANSFKKTFTRNTTFNLPVQMEERVRATLREVQLYVKTGNSDWVRQDVVSPQTPHFTYRVPSDGEYWFALITVDRNGKASSDIANVTPALRVVVDTKAPVVETATVMEAGEPVLRVNVVDANPDTSSLRAAVVTDQGDRALEPVPGQPAFRLSPNELNSTIRVTAADMSGNVTVHDATASFRVAPKDGK